MSGKEETVPAVVRGRPKVLLLLAYPWGPAGTVGEPSLEEKIELANHKPLGAYAARRFAGGWSWVPAAGQRWIGPKMALVAQYVAGNPGCSKTEAARGAGLFGRHWESIDRAIGAPDYRRVRGLEPLPTVLVRL
jgi:hypothetical protein